MPLANCDKCGNDTFRIELRRFTVVVGEARMTARTPAQICLKCGRAMVEWMIDVEEIPLQVPEGKPPAPPPDPPKDQQQPPSDDQSPPNQG